MSNESFVCNFADGVPEDSVLPGVHRGVGLWRPREPRTPTGGEKVGGERSGAPTDRENERRRLARPSRPLPARAGRKTPVPPEPDLGTTV